MARATAECTCKTCGAKFTKSAIKYNRREADSWEEWAVQYFDECEDCYRARQKAERDAANAEAAEVAKDNGWVTLTGSEKQVAWAETIRAELMSEIDTFRAIYRKSITHYTESNDAAHLEQVQSNMDAINRVAEYLESITDASWFIDNRDRRDIYSDHRVLFKEIIRKIEGGEIVLASAANDEANAAAEEAKEELIVEPAEKTHGVAEIRVTETSVDAISEKDDTFMEIVKKLGYSWEKSARVWRKKLNSMTGSGSERAAELGNKLLNAGFAVSIADSETRRAAVEGRYEPECHRWIARHPNGSLLILWEGRNERLYESAKRLPGARYNSEYRGVTVPVIEHATVKDFAHTYGFKLTVEVEEAISVVVAGTNVVTPAEEKNVSYDEHPVDEILNTSRDVLDDLKDD